MSRKAPPPAYVAHRGVFMTIVIILALVIGFAVLLVSPGLITFVQHTVDDLHRAWVGWRWELF